MPSGKLLPVEGTPYDFTGREGARLGHCNLDDSFVHLRPGLLDNGPMAELRDPKNDYGLRITALSSSIKAIRVYAPPDASFVSIDPQSNYDDPFGRSGQKTKIPEWSCCSRDNRCSGRSGWRYFRWDRFGSEHC